MERTDPERKPISPRSSRRGDSGSFSLREILRRQGDRLRDLLRGKPALLILLCLFIMVVNAPTLIIPPRTYTLGEIAPVDIKAKQDQLIEDRAATDQKKQEAALAVPAVYDFDEEVGSALQRRIQHGFQIGRDERKGGGPGDKPPGPVLQRRLEAVWQVEVSPKEWEILVLNRFSPDLEANLNRMIQSVLAVGVVTNKLALMNETERGITVRKLPSAVEVPIKEVERFPDLDEARDRLEKRAAYLLTGIKGELRKVTISLSQKMIVPNLTWNKRETEERRERAVRQTRPVFFQVEKGEILVREGEKITEAALTKIIRQQEKQQGLDILMTSLGLAFIWGLLIFMAYRMIVAGCRMTVDNGRDLVFLGGLLALSFFGIRTADLVTQIVVSSLPAINPRSALLALPLAAAPMMISLVLGAPVSILFTLIQAFLVSLFLEGGPGFSVYFAIAGLWASQSQRTCHHRWDLIRLGFYLGLINVAGLLALQMMQGQLFQWQTVADILFGFSGGVLTGILVTGFSPLVERLFGYTTDMRLLERASMDQPLLRDLMIQAPGTYHHSIIVGNMVEAAAEAIGAKPLLARVSAYFHDIGKIVKPLYFIENQMGGENKHEKLAPSMSSLILISHIKDGVELARKARLESPIIDIIQQHHGTNRIAYFYQKALELKGNDPGQVSLEDFRYPGPKPQTKEAGLVMLADAIEAASRTLVDPTPSRIQGLVHRIINQAFTDGQLEECELTLQDLTRIAGSFNKILNGIFHHRIEYPEAPGKGPPGKRKSNGDQTKQSAETDPAGSGGAGPGLLAAGPGTSAGGSQSAAGGRSGNQPVQPPLP